MNCQHCEKLIPLYISGDLETQQFALVREHLIDCANCRALAADFQGSRDWLAGLDSTQFDASLFDEMRGAVRNEIAQDFSSGPHFFDWLKTSWNPRLAAVAVALLMIGAFLTIYFSRQPSSRQSTTAIKREQAPPGLNLPSDDEPGPQHGRQNITSDRAQRNTENNSFARSNPRSGRQKSLFKLLGSAPKQEMLALNPGLPDRLIISDEQQLQPEMARIEFQTADPNIKIIWLTPLNSNPAANQPEATDQ